MKQIITCALPLLMLLGCRKDCDPGQDFVGKWEFEQFVGYPANETAPAGNGRLLTLSNDGTFKRWEQGSVVSTGTYSVRKKKDCNPRTETKVLEATDSYFNELYINIVQDRLTLSTSNCLMDGGVSFYRRVE